MKNSPVFPILFNPKERKFLGRRGQWQTPQEFLNNPPEAGIDIVADPTRDPDLVGDPGGGYQCINHVLYYVDTDPNTGETRMRRVGTC